MKVKAQAAMEFLMTYGWAILVVLVAIGALAYFGVLSPDNFLPERCTGPAGLDCIDNAAIDATNDNVTFILKNNLGFGIDTLSVQSASDQCTLQSSFIMVENSTGAFNASNKAANNRKIRFAVECSNDFDTGRFKSDIRVGYRNSESSLSHQASVSITGKAT